MHVKRYHQIYNANRTDKVSLKRFAKFAATFRGDESDEARRWLSAKGIKVEN